MRFKCLILDHDDTAVNSTPTIHYPAFQKTLTTYRPGLSVSLETWLEKNFRPGFMEYVQGELGFSGEELDGELAIWREFTSTRIPPFFDGFLSVIGDFVSRGGIVTVVSHSEVPMIERDYREAGAGHLISRIYGWHSDGEKRKPHPWPVERILEEFGLERKDALILDDLYPAVEMGRASGVAVAGAGWGHSLPSIRKTMREEADWYFSTIDEWGKWLLEENRQGR